MAGYFKTEAELCEAFLKLVPKSWTPYPETGGFDIILSHQETGIQIGVEAKLVLNAKVLCQVIGYRRFHSGPDFRAVLIDKSVSDMVPLANALGVTILQLQKDDRSRFRLYPQKLIDLKKYDPEARYWLGDKNWVDEAPISRVPLPAYVPRVAAGVPSPRKLSDWTISAIKLCIFVERLGYVTRQHFQALRLSPSLWMDSRRNWLKRGDVRGQWVRGDKFPAKQYEANHPITWTEIESDFALWGQEILLSIDGIKNRGGGK